MRWLLLFGLLLAACSKGPEADLPSISEARSLAAEWALVNEQQANGHVTAIYAHSMRGRLRQQLETDLTLLTHPQSPYGAEVRALLAARDDASPAELRAHARALKQIEDGLESA